jgi:hypothetical protein
MSAEAPGNQFEFSQSQNRVIGDLASGLRIVGMLLFVFGVMTAVVLVTQLSGVGMDWRFRGPALVMAATALIYLSLGWWFQKSSVSFNAVATTQGQDVTHLMTALDDLRKSFSLIRLLILIYGMIILVGLIAAAVAWYQRQPA